MKLYKIGAFLAVLICVFALVFSYLTWQDKLENVLEQPEEQKTQTSGKKEASTKETKEQNNRELSVNIKELSANADQAIQDLLIERSDNSEKVQLLIAGSAALDSGNPGYAERLKESLETSYGDFIEVDVLSLTGTS